MTIVSVLSSILLAGHVATGFVGLVSFWVPLFARKGGRLHVLSGRVYTYCAYVVTGTAITVSIGRIVGHIGNGVSLAETPGAYAFSLFLGYLGVATFATVHHAIRVVETRRAPEELRTPFHEAVAWAPGVCSAGIAVLALAFWSGMSPLLLALSPIGFILSWTMLRVVYDPAGRHMRWFYSHLGSMIGGGIAFHTAFIVFGAQRIYPYEMEGTLGLVPWVAPTLLGLPAIFVWTRYYQRRFAPAASAS